MTVQVSLDVLLMDGTANGRWCVTRTLSTGVAYKAPRKLTRQLAGEIPDDSSCVYILIGPTQPNNDTKRIYVGETDGLKHRIDKHLAQKDFWDQVIVLTSSQKGGINKALVLWLETALLDLAERSQACEVVNKASGKQPSLSDTDTITAEGFLEELLLVLPVLGAYMFANNTKNEGSLLYLEGVDTNAEGTWCDDVFTVHTNSTGRIRPKSVLSSSDQGVRQRMLDTGCLVVEGGKYRFTRDYEFKSPSVAARVLLDMRVSGWDRWKDVEGRTLRELER